MGEGPFDILQRPAHRRYAALWFALENFARRMAACMETELQELQSVAYDSQWYMRQLGELHNKYLNFLNTELKPFIVNWKKRTPAHQVKTGLLTISNEQIKGEMMPFYNCMFKFMRDCRKNLEMDVGHMLQTLDAYKEDPKTPNFRARVAKLEMNLADLRGKEVGVGELVLPNLKVFLDALLVTNRNSKVLWFKMFGEVRNTKLENFLGKELIPRQYVLDAQEAERSAAAISVAPAASVVPEARVVVRPTVTEPVVATRVAQPVVATRVVQPVVAARVVQPVVAARVVQPVVAARIARPVVAARVAQPVVATRVARPVVTTRVAQPRVAQPVVATRVAPPVVTTRVAQPVVATRVPQPVGTTRTRVGPSTSTVRPAVATAARTAAGAPRAAVTRGTVSATPMVVNRGRITAPAAAATGRTSLPGRVSAPASRIPTGGRDTVAPPSRPAAPEAARRLSLGRR